MLILRPLFTGIRILQKMQPTCLHETTFSSQQAIVRFKSRKAGKKNQEDDDEDSDDDNNEDEKFSGKGVEVKSHIVGSMRADLLLKLGLNISRNYVEKAFYEGKIRINSLKILKKSVHVRLGDELDLIKGHSPSNPSFLIVGRLEILSTSAREEGIEVKIRRSKALIIENYPDGDPWKPSE